MLELTVQAVFEDYLRARNPMPSTQALYRRVFKNTFQDWLPVPLEDINRATVLERFKTESETAPQQTDTAFHVLSALFSFASRYYEDSDGNRLFTRSNPCEIISAVKGWNGTPRRTRRIPPEKLALVWAEIQELRQPYQRDLLVALILTGLRFNEVAELRWKNVDLSGGALVGVNLKQQRPHAMPLSDFLWRLFRRRYFRALDQGPDAFVFPTRNGLALTSRSNFYRPIIEKTGVPWSFHDLRRGFIATAVAIGVPAIEIKMLVGHAVKGDMTMRYAALSLDELRPSMQRITDELLRQAMGAPFKKAQPPEPRPVRCRR
ncbi:MAG: site-specific integrase [Cyanobacteria bacterium SZAS LIN-3]|nr:site-specific integrase [Cyanobacteria bacterium SZAS LIN-3]